MLAAATLCAAIAAAAPSSAATSSAATTAVGATSAPAAVVPLASSYRAVTTDYGFQITSTTLTPATTTIVFALPDGAWQGHGIDAVDYVIDGPVPAVGTAPIDHADETVTVALPAVTTSTGPIHFVLKRTAARSEDVPAPTRDQSLYATDAAKAYRLDLRGTIAWSSTPGDATARVVLSEAEATASILDEDYYWAPQAIPLGPGGRIRFTSDTGRLSGSAWGGGVVGPTATSTDASSVGLTLSAAPDARSLEVRLGAGADLSHFLWPTSTPAYLNLYGYPAPLHSIHIQGPITPTAASPGLPTVARVAGADRFSTAAALSSAAYPSGTDTVYLVNGYGFADALSAGPAASAHSASLLLTDPSGIPQPTLDEIARLHADSVVIVGGASAVSSSVEDALEALVPHVVRVAGADRYATSRAVLDYAFPADVGASFFATGRDFADALAGAAAASAHGEALLLVDGAAGSLDSATAEAVSRSAGSPAVVVGGPAAVTPALQAAIAGLVPGLTRVAGADRFETAATLAAASFPDGAEHAYIATGIQFPDALAVSGVAGHPAAPLLLAHPSCLPGAERDLITTLGVGSVAIVGGPSALGPQLTSLTRC
jgi:putative cell wall-binding protein